MKKNNLHWILMMISVLVFTRLYAQESVVNTPTDPSVSLPKETAPPQPATPLKEQLATPEALVTPTESTDQPTPKTGPMRDPTEPPIIQDRTTPEKVALKKPSELKAIFIFKDVRVAVIGDSVLKEGDQIGNFTLTKITPYTVELTDAEGKTEKLELVVNVKE